MYCIKCEAEIQDGSVYCSVCGKKQVKTPEQTKRHRRGNGQGSVYKRGTTWQVEIVVGKKPDGRPDRRYKGGFRTKKEALDYIPTLRDSRFNPATKARTVQYYYDSWCKTDKIKLSKSKQYAYNAAWDKIRAIHNLPVTALSIVQLRDLVADEAPTFYPARDIKTLLSKLLTLAIADQQITVNMADYISLPKLNEKEQTPWNEDELRAIWSAYDEGDAIASYMLLMIYTGMMPGELDMCLRKMIKLDERQIVGAGIKTNVRKSTPIVIAELIVPVIEQILTYTEDDPEQRILYTDRWSFYDAYHEFNKSHGLRDLPMYSCRHTTATALAVGTDVAPSIIQKIMRHAKFTTTQRYIHPDSTDALIGVNKLSR